MKKSLTVVLLSLILVGSSIIPAVSVLAADEATETTPVEVAPVAETTPAAETLDEYPLLTEAKVVVGYMEAGTYNEVAALEEFKVDLGSNFEFTARDIEGYEFAGITASYGWGGTSV